MARLSVTVTQNLPVLAIQRNSGGGTATVCLTLRRAGSICAFFGLNAPPNRAARRRDASGKRGLSSRMVSPRLRCRRSSATHIDAYNVTVQHQMTQRSRRGGYVGNKELMLSQAAVPITTQPGYLEGFQGVPFRNRQPFFNRFGWTQNSATSAIAPITDMIRCKPRSRSGSRTVTHSWLTTRCRRSE